MIGDTWATGICMEYTKGREDKEAISEQKGRLGYGLLKANVCKLLEDLGEQIHMMP